MRSGNRPDLFTVGSAQQCLWSTTITAVLKPIWEKLLFSRTDQSHWCLEWDDFNERKSGSCWLDKDSTDRKLPQQPDSVFAFCLLNPPLHLIWLSHSFSPKTFSHIYSGCHCQFLNQHSLIVRISSAFLVRISYPLKMERNANSFSLALWIDVTLSRNVTSVTRPSLFTWARKTMTTIATCSQIFTNLTF